MAVAVTNRVTPRQIQEARQRAVKACAMAYAPQPVKQPDGTTIELCFVGRLQRANALLWRETDESRIKLLRKAVDRLDTEYQFAVAEAERAAGEWAQLCASAGVEHEHTDVYPALCECDGCQLDISYYEKLADVRQAITGLFYSVDGRPDIMTLDDAKLLERIKGTVRPAIQAYQDAAIAFGKDPDWFEMWR